MVEGPNIRYMCERLHALLAGLRIQSVQGSPVLDGVCQDRIEGIAYLGKYLFLNFASGRHLKVHFGWYGCVTVEHCGGLQHVGGIEQRGVMGEHHGQPKMDHCGRMQHGASVQQNRVPRRVEAETMTNTSPNSDRPHTRKSHPKHSRDPRSCDVVAKWTSRESVCGGLVLQRKHAEARAQALTEGRPLLPTLTLHCDRPDPVADSVAGSERMMRAVVRFYLEEIPPVLLPQAPDLGAAALDISSVQYDPSQSLTAVQRANSQRVVAEVLMDQRLCPGMGNILKVEALYEAGVHPQCPFGSLTPNQVWCCCRHCHA